jgi:Fur family ferric uptake transcriptional regulator
MATRSDYATRPREQVASILRSQRRFLSAGEIHRVLTERHSKVSLSTVYRTLEYLAQKGDATARIDDSGEATYTACEPARHHHHAICEVCGRVEDVSCDAVDRFTDSLRELHGFELSGHKMEFVGRCRSCR